MKNVVIIILVVIVLVVFILNITSIASPEVRDERFDVDILKDLTLNFEKAKIRVEEWDEKNVQISYESLKAQDNKDIKIEMLGNNISCKNFESDKSFTYKVKTWASLIQFERFKKFFRDAGVFDYEIRVPKGSRLNIKAKYVSGVDCSIIAQDGETATFKTCKMLSGFTGVGSSITLRGCTIEKDGLFKNYKVSIRESTSESMILSSDNEKRNLDVEIRDVKGSEITLNADVFNSLNFLIRDSSFKKLTVNSREEKGSVVVADSTVDEIANNSKLKIARDR